MGTGDYNWVCPICGQTNSILFCSCEKCGKIEFHNQLKSDKNK